MIGIIRGPGAYLPVIGGGLLPYPANPDDTKPVVALLGDSITEGNTPTSSGDVNRGYWHWAQALSGFRAYCGAYAGVGGNITTQMLARLNDDVITPLSAPAYDDRDKYCVVMGGVNDSTNTSDIVATATGNLTSIYSALIAAGITPIAMTITPTSTCTTSTQIANWNGINAWLRSYCPANSITLVDNIANCLDQAFPATTTPLWWSGGTHDGVHPTARGALAIAQPLATTLAALLPAVDHFQAATAPFYGSILSNHAMLGTGGALSGATGQVADSWKLTVGVGSKAARTDGINGEWQIVAISGGSTRFDPNPSIDVTSGFRVGDTVAAQVEIVPVDDWDTITAFVLVLEFRNGSTVLQAKSFLANDPNSGDIPNAAPGDTLVLRTVPAVVPATTNILRTYCYLLGAAGSAKIGRYELVKLAAA